MKVVARTVVALISLVSVGVVGSTGGAGAEELMRGIPSAEEWRRALEEPTPSADPGSSPGDETTRAIFPTPQPETPEKAKTKVRVSTQTRPAAPAMPREKRAASALILFEYNSAMLTPSAREQLDQLAEALSSPGLSTAVFRIEGHTDAIGGEAYNLKLSEERAAAVVNYLVERGIDSARLQPVGRGEKDLYDPRNPTAPENRRVKVINLSS